MRAKTILSKFIEKSLPGEIHMKRLLTLKEVSAAAVAAESLTVTGIGRALAQTSEATTVKHCIKRVDRLMSNSLLHDDTQQIYEHVAHLLLEGIARPVILVDWTEVDRRYGHALVASVPLDGRAQIIYSRVVPLSQLGSVTVEREFLQELSVILPSRCKPVIVTDAGFKTKWCDNVRSLGWDFITRVRGATLFSEAGEPWRKVTSLHAEATSQAQSLPSVTLTQSQPRPVRLVVSSRPKRHRHVNTISGRVRRSGQELKQRKGQSEPWVLATSLEREHAERIVGIYAMRMRIEEGFRDAKTIRFGLGLEQARGRPERIAVLLLIAALASLALLLLGVEAERRGCHYAFQANTVREKRVLSLLRLGLELWRCNSALVPPPPIEIALRGASV